MPSVPKFVLAPGLSVIDYEASDVQTLYSNGGYSIQEESTDYVALNYMNEAAIRYWMPRFVDYVINRAPRHSLHCDILLGKFASEDFYRILTEPVDPTLVEAASSFLAWFRNQRELVEGSDMRQRLLATALKMWRA